MKICLRSEVNLQVENLQGWLYQEKTYVVLSVEQYSSDEIGFRVESEDGEQPVVFRASLFDVIDSRLPACWRVLAIRANTIELGPEAFGQVGFWEKCFDRDPLAVGEYLRTKAQVTVES